MRNFVISVVCFFVLVTPAFAGSTAKITVKTIDENGKALQGAEVHVSFTIGGRPGIGLTSTRQNGLTNPKGIFVVSGETIREVKRDNEWEQ